MQPKLPSFAWLCAVCEFLMVLHNFPSRGRSGRIGENRGESGKIGENRGESGRIGENRGKRAKQAKLGKNCRELWKTNAVSSQILQNGAIASYGQFFWQANTSTGFLHSKMIKDREHHGKPTKIFKNNVEVCKTQQIGSGLLLGLSKQTKCLIVLSNQPQKQQIARLWLSVSHVSTNVLPKMTTFGKICSLFVRESFWSSFFSVGSCFGLFWYFWNGLHRSLLCCAHFHPVFQVVYFSGSLFSTRVPRSLLIFFALRISSVLRWICLAARFLFLRWHMYFAHV